jgi:hypothetical protein
VALLPSRRSALPGYLRGDALQWNVDGARRRGVCGAGFGGDALARDIELRRTPAPNRRHASVPGSRCGECTLKRRALLVSEAFKSLDVRFDGQDRERREVAQFEH